MTNIDAQPLPELIPAAVAYVLRAAEVWPSWDGEPIRHGDSADDEWTPHKALRRVADHLTDHLAELEARLADVLDQRPAPETWTVRELVHHTAGATRAYADAMSPASQPESRESFGTARALAQSWAAC